MKPFNHTAAFFAIISFQFMILFFVTQGLISLAFFFWMLMCFIAAIHSLIKS